MESYSNRLERLRSALTMNWGELAEHLGMSRAMMDFLRAGTRKPSPKTERKIIEAERKAGLAVTMAVREPEPKYGQHDPDPYAALTTEQLESELARLRSLHQSCEEGMKRLRSAVQYRITRVGKSLQGRRGP